MQGIRRRLAAVLMSERMSSGRGFMIVISGVLAMIVSVLHHVDLWHVAAVIAFVLLVFGMRKMAALDAVPRSSSTRFALRLVDWASVALLVAVPYVPFSLFTYHGDEFWAVMALFGSTLLLWNVLGELIVFKRSLILVMIRIVALWALAMVLRPALDELGEVAAIVLLLSAGALTLTIVVRAIRVVPRQWAAGWTFAEDADARPL